MRLHPDPDAIFFLPSLCLRSCVIVSSPPAVVSLPNGSCDHGVYFIYQLKEHTTSLFEIGGSVRLGTERHLEPQRQQQLWLESGSSTRMNTRSKENIKEQLTGRFPVSARICQPARQFLLFECTYFIYLFSPAAALSHSWLIDLYLLLVLFDYKKLLVA
jgi:hypothetical protein